MLGIDELPSQANHYGPYGRCWRTIHAAQPGKPYDGVCRNPAVSDVGLCSEHVTELASR